MTELDGALKLTEAVEWKPIESAPRRIDAIKWILVANIENCYQSVSKVRWWQNENYDLGWVGYDAEGIFTIKNATHWMPLPNPPMRKK